MELKRRQKFMKIRELIDFINNTKNKMLKGDQLRQVIAKALEVKPYLSIKEKKNLIDNIVNHCILFENGVFKFNEIDKYIAFTMMTIAAYTNLELSFDMEDDYDMLCEAKLLNAVIETFAGEYDNVKLLLAMQCDYILNDNNIEAQIGRMLTSILDKLDVFSNQLSEKLDSFSFDNLPIDMDNIKKLMEFVNSQKK
jgi:hypothetical protein